MKVYITPNEKGRALERVTKALKNYRPKRITMVDDKASAELVVLHVVGRHDAVLREAEAIRARGQAYAVIQYALRSTLKPNTADWMGLWYGAELVWSYYNLGDLIGEDGVELTGAFNFYHSPLGVDATVFRPLPSTRKALKIVTTGRSWLTESVRECAIAAQRVGGAVAHIGAELNRPPVMSYTNISDSELASIYSASEFVSGLRRIEGFELPAAEGLLCGARPILFDRAHYRDWYGDSAVYIPERERQQTIENLETVFKVGVRPVSARERTAAKKRFDWQTIIGGFWGKV